MNNLEIYKRVEKIKSILDTNYVPDYSFDGYSKSKYYTPIKYSDYLAECIDKSISYTEYLRAGDKSIDYSNYIAEKIMYGN